MVIQPRSLRQAVSLLEVIVVIAIIAILISLLLPAIQKVRSEAVRLKSHNNLRQISIATQNYAAAHPRLPYYSVHGDKGDVDSNPIVCVLRFAKRYQAYEAKTPSDDYAGELFQNPGDPSFAAQPGWFGDCSYASSVLVFRRGATLTTCCPDGLSNTIGWAERYARCSATGFRSSIGDTCGSYVIKGTTFYDPLRRASFADRECGDVYPVTSQGVARPVLDGWHPPSYPFQVLPRADKCDPSVPTATHPAGLSVAMMDGSVRTLSPGISLSTFWGHVSPDGGEVLGDW